MLQCSIPMPISSFNLGRYRCPKPALRKPETRSPHRLKDFAQQGVDYSKNLAEKSEAMADAAGKSMRQTYSTAVSEAANFNVQFIEMMRNNANASLDFARQMVTAKSPTEFFELSTAHARKQMETLRTAGPAARRACAEGKRRCDEADAGRDEERFRQGRLKRLPLSKRKEFRRLPRVGEAFSFRARVEQRLADSFACDIYD